MNSYDRELGILTAKMQAMENDMVEMRADVKAIRTTLSEARGGWKALAIVSGISATVGGLLTKLAPLFLGLPR